MTKRLIFKPQQIAQLQNSWKLSSPPENDDLEEPQMYVEPLDSQVQQEDLEHSEGFKKIEQVEMLLEDNDPDSLEYISNGSGFMPDTTNIVSKSKTSTHTQPQATNFQELDAFDTGSNIPDSIEEKLVLPEQQTDEKPGELNISTEQVEEEAKKILLEIKEEIKKMKEEGQREASQIVEEAKEKAANIIKESEEKEEEIKKSIKEREQELLQKIQKESQEAKEQAYNESQKEMKRLVETLSSIVTEATDLHTKVMVAAEKQMVEQILLIAYKIIKDEINVRSNVVLNNVKAVLQELKECEKIRIRVNLKDLDITTEHKKEFIALLEEKANVIVLEDSRVDKGGCVIESDIGSIDAKISTQMGSIANAIRAASPI